jgi:hypothetical protein
MARNIPRYTRGVALVLALAALSGMTGVLLWPAVALHVAMVVWSVFGRRSSSVGESTTLNVRFARPSTALPAQERGHEELCLFRAVGVVRADRARPPRPASHLHAIGARRAFQVASAGDDIVARV